MHPGCRWRERAWIVRLWLPKNSWSFPQASMEVGPWRQTQSLLTSQAWKQRMREKHLHQVPVWAQKDTVQLIIFQLFVFRFHFEIAAAETHCRVWGCHWMSSGRRSWNGRTSFSGGRPGGRERQPVCHLTDRLGAEKSSLAWYPLPAFPEICFYWTSALQSWNIWNCFFTSSILGPNMFKVCSYFHLQWIQDSRPYSRW